MKQLLVRVAKGLGILVAAAVLFLVVVVNFGTVESRLECSGQLRRQVADGHQQVNAAATLYAKVETYRWFLLWYRHDAMITWEVRGPRVAHTGFGYYDRNDFGSQIVDLEGKKNYGTFSPLSNRIYIAEASYSGDEFDGMCRAT
jgi:hypothetical protein